MLCHEIFLAAEENSLSPGTGQPGQGQLGNSVSTPERWIAFLNTVCFGDYPERERASERPERGGPC
jgi:hypothetical protein